MEKSRRRFMTELSALTVGATLIPLSDAKALAPERGGGSSDKRYAMLIDLRKCIGCQACTVSCSMENKTPLNQFRSL